MFVEHPEPQGPPLSGGAEGGEFFLQRRLERLRGGRVFFGVGLARHFQDPADFSRERIHARERQRALRARFDPCLRLFRPAKLARAQCVEEGRVVVRGQGRRAPAFVLARQQPGEAAGQELLQIAEHRRAGHSRRRRDLRGIQLVLRHQAHHQQALALPRCRVLAPRRLHFRSFRRPYCR